MGYLREREHPYEFTDEDVDQRQKVGLYTETNFTHAHQDVEKTEIDLFGIIQEKEITCSDLFCNILRHMFYTPLVHVAMSS